MSEASEVEPRLKTGASAPKKKKKAKRRNYSAQADVLFGKIIRARGRCENCGKAPPTVNLQCAHGFSRRYRAVRWTEDNAFCLCAGCHYFFTLNPLHWDEWLLNVWGDDLYYRLRRAALDGEKPDLPELVRTLTAQLERTTSP